ncbi:hypothetical protein [Streptomyces sp. NPDC002825]|uniref:hypothetical protein n=1 Tax=Streptomyces sp. NPDC002825 TaxID=3154666 RepID=UPI0033261AE7
MTSALGLEKTAWALEKYRRRAGGLIVWGIVLTAAATGFAIALADSEAEGAAIMPLVAGILSLGGGLGSKVMARRMRRTLGRGLWSAHPAVSVDRKGHATTLVLRSPDGTEVWPMTVIATRQRYERVRPGRDGVLWWCGDPRVGGVVAPPGGGELVWVKPLRGARVRRRIVAGAEAQGLLRRTAPRQPQEAVDAAGPLSRKGTDQPVTGPKPVLVPGPVPVSVDGPHVRHEPPPEFGPTYAVLAEHAQRQATPLGQGRAPRPEADVREAAWWRVRSLRWAAGVQRVPVALGFCAAVGALLLTEPPPADAVKLYGVGALALGALVYAVCRLLAVGRPVARRLARAATASVEVERRYVLLYDPQGGGAPVLVLFPMYGSGGAQAEGVLALLPPGSPKKPRRGLPALPVGTATLRGWRDFTPDDRMPYVVPWINGRPLWTVGPYWQTDGRPEFVAFLERLAPPLEDRTP